MAGEVGGAHVLIRSRAPGASAGEWGKRDGEDGAAAIAFVSQLALVPTYDQLTYEAVLPAIIRRS